MLMFNNRVQDASQLTPLHLCVQTGNDNYLRNLVRKVFFLFFEEKD